MRHFIMIPIACILAFGCTKNSDHVEQLEAQVLSEEGMSRVRNMTIDGNGLSNVKAIIKTVQGNIVIRFYPKKAPNTVARITDLIEKGFYNGLEFHRVVEGFVIQTGDPTNEGNGGTGVKLKAEINNLQHVKGTVGLARLDGDVDSGDSQFYITLSTVTHLDGKYTIFGQVTDGLDIISNIKKGDRLLSAILVTDES